MSAERLKSDNLLRTEKGWDAMRRGNAVSHVVGFVLTFVIISATVATVIYSTSIMINQRLGDTTKVVAQSIANAVADAVTEAIAVRQNFPEAEYHRSIEIPREINGKQYYIEATQDYIYVNTTDGISVRAPTYNQKELGIGITGRVEGGVGRVSVDCKKITSILEIDFGLNHSYTSPGAYGYRRVTGSSSRDLYDNNGNMWWDPNYTSWLYRVPIMIVNHNSYPLYDYQVRVFLHPSNFAYKVARKDGADIRFAEVDGTPIPYWIERWEFNGASYIWLNVSEIPPGEKKIYMYCGYMGGSIVSESNGSRVFLLFDDFSSSTIDSNRWATYGDEVYIEGGCLILKNGSAVVSKKIFSDGIMEARAMALDTGAGNTEASMFVRSSDINDPYNNAFLFSTGSFRDYPERNFSIGTSYDSLYYISKDKMDTWIWYRLSLSFRSYNFTATRYHYYPSTVPESIEGTFSVPLSGHLGLHTSLDGCMAKYDWVLVTKVSDNQPLTFVDGIVCRNYRWLYSSLDNLLFNCLPSSDFTDPLHDDWVGSMYVATFSIGPIENNVYSILLYIGDRYRDVDTSVYINGKLALDQVRCSAGFLKTELAIVEVENRYINITFSPQPPSGYWAVTGMKIERGIRSVILGGG